MIRIALNGSIYLWQWWMGKLNVIRTSKVVEWTSDNEITNYFIITFKYFIILYNIIAFKYFNISTGSVNALRGFTGVKIL